MTRVDAKLTEFKIALSAKTYRPGAFAFVAKNSGHTVHALRIQGPGGEHRTKNIEPGKSATLRVTLKAGKYELDCPVDEHEDLGMKTKITVGGSASPSAHAAHGHGH